MCVRLSRTQPVCWLWVCVPHPFVPAGFWALVPDISSTTTLIPKTTQEILRAAGRTAVGELPQKSAPDRLAGRTWAERFGRRRNASGGGGRLRPTAERFGRRRNASAGGRTLRLTAERFGRRRKASADGGTLRPMAERFVWRRNASAGARSPSPRAQVFCRGSESLADLSRPASRGWHSEGKRVISEG